MSEQQGPQNSIQFIVMLVKAFVTGVPKMIKTIIITAVISGVFTLGLHFYLILVPNDGFNSSGNPILDSILVLANVNPTPPNVLLFWFLLNFLFWWIIGVFREKGIIGGVKQFVTTPIFIAKSLRDAGLGAFPMLMAGLAFAFTMRLAILGTMTTLQMFLMTIGVLVSQTDSIVLIGLQLGFKDVKGLVSRGQPVQLPGIALPATMVLGSVLGFAYLVYFPFNALMAQALVALMVIGLIVLFMRGRKSGGVNTLAMVLMLLFVFAVAAQPALADDGGAAESGGAMNVINNPTLRDYMISQGISPALAGIAAALAAQGRLTPGLFDQLRRGRLGPRPGETIQEMQTRHQIQSQILRNLQHMDSEIWFGRAQRLWRGEGEPGNVRAHIDKLIDDMLNGKDIDLNKYNQIYTVYTGHVTGRTITEDMIPTSNQLWRETISDGIAWTTREIVTGRTIDGETSYMSFALRGLLGIATGGSSEYVYVPANSLYTMQNYVNNGGSSILGGFMAGSGEAIFQWGVGRVIGGGFNLAGRGLGRVGGYLATRFPDAARSVSSGLSRINNVLNTKITWPGKGGAAPRVPGRPGIGQIRGAQGRDFNQRVINRINNSRTQNILNQVRQRQATGSPYPGIKKPGFTNAGKPPDLRGMTPRDVKALRTVMDRHGVQAHMRPTTKYARGHLERGTAVPKSEMIKNKTINDLDTKLGFPGGDQRGLAACRRPNPLPTSKPPDMSKAQWRELRTRHAQRSMEFRDQSKHLTKLEGQGKITWDRRTGIIYDRATGKPFTGDNDAFSFTDAVTGKPVSPFTNQQINQDLQRFGVTQHNEHLGWDYGNLPRTPGAGGAQSKFQVAQGIDNKILNGHGPGGEPLNTYNPLNFDPRQGYGEGNGWSTSFWTGGTR